MLNKLLKTKYTDETFKKLLATKPPNLKEVRRVLHTNISINHKDNDNATYLHYCLKNNLTSSARCLISEGININISDFENITAMYLAIIKGNKDIAKALIDTNNLNTSILKDNRNLLQDALLQGETYIVNLLLKTDIDINHTDNSNRNIIFDAIANGNEKLIDKILDIDDLDLNILDKDKKTILHQNNVIEDDQLAIKLIRKGADPTILDGTGKSYLLHAALRGIETEEIIDIAVETGFNINSSVRNKNSILMEIMFSFSDLSQSEQSRRDSLMSMATKLVKKGVDVNALNKQGETVLFDAVRKSDIKACAFLLAEKVPVNIINNEGDSALSIIIYNGIKSLDIIFLLLKYGADINIKNKYGQGLVEILNDLILYTHDNMNIRKELKSKVSIDAQYIRLLSEILAITSFDVNSASSTAEPIFFKSLLNHNKALFDLYYKFGMDINTCDIHGDTIFIRYINNVAQMEEFPSDFREILVMLVLRKVNINQQNEAGKTILHRLIKNNNIKLFRVLFSVAKFDYSLQDKKGFTIIHDCISTSNITILKLFNNVIPDLKNVPDNIGLLPITYAALFGKTNLVLELIKLESHFKSEKRIPIAAKAKLSPLLSNLDGITCSNANDLHNLNILKDQIRRDLT